MAPGGNASSSATTITAFTAICYGRLATRRASASFAYCLMPNHVHLILTTTADGLARALGKAHRGTGAVVNARLWVTAEDWRGLATEKLPER